MSRLPRTNASPGRMVSWAWSGSARRTLDTSGMHWIRKRASVSLLQTRSRDWLKVLSPSKRSMAFFLSLLVLASGALAIILHLTVTPLTKRGRRPGVSGGAEGTAASRQGVADED